MAYTLANLQEDIRNYTEVDSSVFSDSILDPIIKNAENRIYRDSDSDDNRFYATSTLVTGNRYVTIPSDLRSIRYVQLKDTNVTPNVQTFLEKKEASYMATFYDTPDTASGIPKYYAVYNDKNIIVAPTPSSALAIQIQYVKNPPHFDSSTTTMLSDQFQNLLLYGVLVECFSYLKGPLDMYNLYKTRYDKALEAFALEQMGSRRRGQYTDGVPRVKIDSPSP